MSAGVGAAARAVKNAAKNSDVTKEAVLAKCFAIKGIPTTAAVPDLYRALSRPLKQCSVASISMQYNRFLPTGRAIVQLQNPDLRDKAMRIIHKQQILGLTVKTMPMKESDLPNSKMPGTNLRTIHPYRELDVVIWGLPGRLKSGQLEYALKEFDMQKNETGEAKIVQVPLPERAFSLYSRFCVSMSTPEEAHRLVRKLHMTHWDKERQFLIYARVVD